MNNKDTYEKKSIGTFSSGWIYALVVPICSVIIIIFEIVQNENTWGFNSIAIVVSLLLINMGSMYIYENVKEYTSEKLKKEFLDEQRIVYIEQCEKVQQILVDMDQFYELTKRRYVENNDNLFNERYDVLQKSYGEVIEQFESTGIVSDTGNIFIDAIINYKIEYAKKLNIETSVDIRFPLDFEKPMRDISFLLGNLFDNAIEASKELDDNRYLNFKILYHSHNLYINIENNYKHTRVLENGKYLTTKIDKKNHGIGLKIVETIVNEYEGNVDMNASDNKFMTTIVLYQIDK